ncbi:hypothetical protein [Streptosporangium subroseum]|uniref:hypothetical protein n=1 Tax=Streptosporangium subroseum TaxID=106412 RepID=UPI00308B7F25|nr:hypothetical protein OHB15_06955 [Streptosporangium subroseum]
MSAEEDFKQVGAEPADLGVRISRMMGSPALKDQAGKVFASPQRDDHAAKPPGSLLEV